ncbi:TPA: hypothetical protein DEO28_04415 [Candidatus Dependentiae bacterium]|nr:MAG: hypothetical protein UR14_C0002G0003 [candidate division TM6 bacterium GW2011_GWE2_31_21]KKP53800.1 MAG: hypothetical protein UR43_C0002G0003 [candidate division TM6 bacterium GW2011_GWF2_33_332]HBS47579.1 hypothetical protein [Candidatus Dependentiae bacterium]HBZ73728.1 hypothetical protein [Candidatus Dependentiae bacterium]
MKNQFLFVLLSILFFLSVRGVCAKDTLNQAQELHKNIGKSLVQIRRDNPALQPAIYTLLDQVGQLYKLVSTTHQKKKNYKSVIKEEKQLVLSINNKMEDMKRQMTGLQFALKSESSKVAESKKYLENLTREKMEFQKKASEAMQKEKEYQIQLKRINEEAIAAVKNEENPAQHPQQQQANSANVISQQQEQAPKDLAKASLEHIEKIGLMREKKA